MAKKRIFISYDYDNDHHLPGSFFQQAEDPKSPFSGVNVSLREAHPDDKWVSEAQRRIQECDCFIVLLGKNTFQAPGVLKEVNIAKGLNKKRFQIRPKGKSNVDNKPLLNAGKVIAWSWDNIFKEINR